MVVIKKDKKFSGRESIKSLFFTGSALILSFCLLTWQLLDNGFIVEWDKAIKRDQHPHYRGILEFTLHRFDDLGSRWLTMVILLTLVYKIFRKEGDRRVIYIFLISEFFLNSIVGVLKILVGRTKPFLIDGAVHSGGMSYPSGHAANTILCWSLILYLYWEFKKPNYRSRALGVVGVVMVSILVFGISLFRDTHWFSDLVAGYLVGGGIFTLVIAGDKFFKNRVDFSNKR